MKASFDLPLAKRPGCLGFSRLELLVVVACLALLVNIPLAALSENLEVSRASLCLNNSRQMISAWQSYADDHGGLLVKSLDSFAVPHNNERGLFMPTFLSYTADPQNWDPAVSVARSALDPYLSDWAAWRCPSDTGILTRDRTGRMVQKQRVRSISMSQVFDFGSWLPASIYRTYSKLSQIENPSRTWVTMDEHPDSINDGAFAVQMAEPGATTARIVDMPGSFHEGGAAMNFGDGHAEIHRWKGRTIRPPVRHDYSLPLNVPAGDSLHDVIWLSQHTTVRKRP